MSEHNDFERRPEDDVWEACFKNVATCDFYFLLIGRNRGSWYNEDDRVSVTRQEFRVASKAALSRPLGISVFVREEVSTALMQWDQDGRPTSSPFVEDPEFTSEFIAEAGEPAAPGQGSRWLYKFSDFRDIVDALNVILRLDTNFERRLLEENLLQEILKNMSRMVTKGEKTSIQTNYGWATHRRREIVIAQEDVGGGTTWLTLEHIRALGFLCFASPHGSLDHEAMAEALRRGLFVTVESQPPKLVMTVEHEALRRLREDVVAFDALRGMEHEERARLELLALARSANSGEIDGGASIDTDTLTIIIGLHDRLDDIFNGLTQMARWLLGAAESPEIERNPTSPIAGFSEEIEAEQVPSDELRWALTNSVFPFGPNLTPDLRETAKNVEDSYFRQLRSALPEEYFDDESLRKLVEEGLDKLVVKEYEPAPNTVRRTKRK